MFCYSWYKSKIKRNYIIIGLSTKKVKDLEIFLSTVCISGYCHHPLSLSSITIPFSPINYPPMSFCTVFRPSYFFFRLSINSSDFFRSSRLCVCLRGEYTCTLTLFYLSLYLSQSGVKQAPTETIKNIVSFFRIWDLFLFTTLHIADAYLNLGRCFPPRESLS